MEISYNLKQIHDLSGWHKKEIQKSKKCGCFHCLKFFSPSKIKEWIEEPKDCPRGFGHTAICPNCGIDSVIPESNTYKLTIELLETMQDYWFKSDS